MAKWDRTWALCLDEYRAWKINKKERISFLKRLLKVK